MDDRSTFIGGSDVAAILDVSEYSTPAGVWREKKGLATRKETARMRAGRYFERFIIDEYAAGLDDPSLVVYEARTPSGELIALAGETVRHAKYPFLGATMDAFELSDDGELVVLDAKLTVKHIESEADLPDDWVLQVNHYAFIIGATRGRILATNPNTWNPYPVDVTIDHEWYESKIVPRLAEFYELLQGDTPPTYRIAEEVDPLPEDVVNVDDLRTYLKAKEEKELAADIEDRFKIRLKEALIAAGLPKKSLCDGKVISVAAISRAIPDISGMLEEHPELADIVAKHTRKTDESLRLSVRDYKPKAKKKK